MHLLDQYFGILLFVLIGVFLGCAPLVLGYILGPRRPNAAKLSPYECGFQPFDDARIPFDVRFYLIAILFILFDLETAFFFPWAIVLRKIGWVGFSSMIMFLAILVVGFIYEWRRGALNWE